MKAIILGVAVCCVALLAFTAGEANSLSDNPPFVFDEIIPVYKHTSETVVCQAACDDYDEPCGEVELVIYNQNGNPLVSQTFNSIPNNGNRYITYSGPKKNISCKITSEDLVISRLKRTVTVLDATYRVLAVTSNDADTLFQ